MPLVHRSSYPGPPLHHISGHLQTILPSLARKVEGVTYERERLELPDGDFLDLDWVENEGAEQLVILTHGLESNTDRAYMKGMARHFYQNGWDVLAWNCRSCSGEMNRNLRLYNHGEIEDIAAVIQHALQQKKYNNVVLVGFSMGGSISIKYLGVHGKNAPEQITRAVAFSSPLDLGDSIRVLEHPQNFLYKRRFLESLKNKIVAKAEQFPGQVDVSFFDQIRRWRDFDTFYSAPLNGYATPEDFYNQASAKNFVSGLAIPVLLVNAKNDPILSPACSPTELAEKSPFFYLETPKNGGHVGFAVKNNETYWSEYRALEFCSSKIF